MRSDDTGKSESSKNETKGWGRGGRAPVHTKNGTSLPVDFEKGRFENGTLTIIF